MKKGLACALLFSALLPPIQLIAQSVASTTSLTKPVAESADPFTLIGAIRELSNGKVLVSDPMDKTVQLVDLIGRTKTQVGREGQGPGEYGFPGELFGLPGDSTLLVDRMNRRFLILLPDGKSGSFIPFPGNLGNGLALPQGTDRNGIIYFQGSAFSGNLQLDFSKAPDSVPILRWDRKRDVVDTITKVKGPALTGGSSNGGRVMMFGGQPFAPEDAWNVAPDGRIAVARVSDYHVEWFGPAHQRVTGPVNRFDPVRVSQADKDARQKMMASGPRIMMRIGSSAPNTSGPPPSMPAVGEPTYPEFKPAFPSRAAWVTPEGMLWVLRSRPASDSVPVLDVFDQRGILVGRVTLPRDRRLVGFGRGTVYLARTDADDLQWLEKYQR